MRHLEIALSISGILLLISSILGGTLIFSSIFILQATLSFWSVQSLEIVNSFSYGGVELASYPLSIYPRVFREIFVFIIPIAFVNYFPGIFLLEKNKTLNISPIFSFISPIVGLLFFFIAYKLWMMGVRYYKSTGS